MREAYVRRERARRLARRRALVARPIARRGARPSAASPIPLTRWRLSPRRRAPYREAYGPRISEGRCRPGLRRRRVARRRALLVGRSREAAELDAAVLAGLAGTGPALVLVLGDAGVGKSARRGSVPRLGRGRACRERSRPRGLSDRVPRSSPAGRRGDAPPAVGGCPSPGGQHLRRGRRGARRRCGAGRSRGPRAGPRPRGRCRHRRSGRRPPALVRRAARRDTPSGDRARGPAPRRRRDPLRTHAPGRPAAARGGRGGGRRGPRASAARPRPVPSGAARVGAASARLDRRARPAGRGRRGRAGRAAGGRRR